MDKIEEVIVKIWDMSQVSNDPIVRRTTLVWAKEELEKIQTRRVLEKATK